MRPAWSFADSQVQLLGTAIHAGHDLRRSIESCLAIDDDTRLREEDPFTDRLAAVGGSTMVVHRSRFEVDLNRPRESAFYRAPEDAWGLRLWNETPSEKEIEHSLEIYDAFYVEMQRRLDAMASRGPFLVLDMHSYNHRRDGARAPASPAQANPEVNVGTGSLDTERWGHVADRFIDELGRRQVFGRTLDVRENVRFRGAELSRWVNTRFGDRGAALAVEFKKVFMDEWTGDPDLRHLTELRRAIEAVVPAVLDELRCSVD